MFVTRQGVGNPSKLLLTEGDIIQGVAQHSSSGLLAPWDSDRLAVAAEQANQ